jgi:hypothetical protein
MFRNVIQDKKLQKRDKEKTMEDSKRRIKMEILFIKVRLEF